MKIFIFISLTCFFTSTMIAQQQIGNSKCGTSSYAYLGQSVKMSTDGQRMIVSGEGYNNLLSARVYEFNNGEWNDLGMPFQNTNVQNNLVLIPVSCNATCNRIVYSDVYNDEAGVNRGKVIIRELTENNWANVGNGIFGEHNNELSGNALDMSASGNRIIVGSSLNDTNGNNAGKVKIYELQNENWVQLGVDLVGNTAGERFGTAVVISADGQRIACGAPFNNNLATRSGKVSIYEFISGAWQLIGQINGTMEDERFGGALSFNETATILAVGCDKFYGFGGGRNTGVEVYEQQGNNWNQLGNTIPAESDTEYFGAALSLSQNGNTIAIGAPQYGINIGDNSGYTKVYQLGFGTWNQVGSTIYGDAGDDYDNLGYSLSFSHTGQLAIGSPFIVRSGQVGCISVYDFSSELATSEWVPDDTLVQVYPNPVESILHLKNTIPGAIFTIKDITGKILIKSDIPTLYLENLSSGIYLLNILSSNQNQTKKIIKK